MIGLRRGFGLGCSTGGGGALGSCSGVVGFRAASIADGGDGLAFGDSGRGGS